MSPRKSVLSAVLAAVVAGCGGSSGGGGPVATTGPLTGSIDVQLSGGEGEIAATRELVESFTAAHPGVDVNLVPVPSQADHVAKLATAFAAGNPPDVFLINYRRFGSFVRSGVIDPAPRSAAAGLYSGPVEAFTHEGRLLCLPQNASSTVVYYNPALFAAAGVPVPKQGWTWDEMLATARALAARGVEAIGFEPSLIRVAPFVWSNGGEIVDDAVAPTRVTLGGSAAREALRFLLDLQRAGLDATERSAQDPESGFAAGRVAMLLESRRAVPGLRKAGVAFDVVGVPVRKTSASGLHADGYCVSRASDNRRLAHAFAAYAVSVEGATVLARSGRTVPSLRSLAESAVFLDPATPPRSSQVFLDAIPTLRTLPSVPGWHEAEETAEDILAQLFAGRLGVDEAVARVATDTEAVLAQAR